MTDSPHNSTADSPERGLLRLKPSPHYLFLEGWSTWIVPAVLVAAVIVLHRATGWISETTRDSVARFAPLLLLLRAGYDWLAWNGIEFVLTDRRAFTHRGISRTQTVELSLDEVSDVRVKRGPLQRLLGVGTLEFVRDSSKRAVAKWEYLVDWEDAREIALAAVKRCRKEADASRNLAD